MGQRTPICTIQFSVLNCVFCGLAYTDALCPHSQSSVSFCRTHILQDSLGGDAKTCVFINTSPAESNLPETLSRCCDVVYLHACIVRMWLGTSTCVRCSNCVDANKHGNQNTQRWIRRYFRQLFQLFLVVLLFDVQLD